MITDEGTRLLTVCCGVDSKIPIAPSTGNAVNTNRSIKECKREDAMVVERVLKMC